VSRPGTYTARRPSRRLIGFAVTSLCLHTGLLFPWSPAAPRIAGHIETVLSVSLNAPVDRATPAAAAAHALDIAARRSHRNKHAVDIPLVAPESESESASPTPATARAAQDDDVVAGDAARHTGGMRARIQAQLRADLQRYFEYPLLARRRGWEGTVWLAFTVAPDGVLERIHVARGSGYDALDHAAIAALRRVDRMREVSAWLNGRALDMELPVIYRLQEP